VRPWVCLPGRRQGPLHRVLPRIAIRRARQPEQNRHNSVKNLVQDSILSTYYSQSQGASFAPIGMAWGNFLLLRNLAIFEIYHATRFIGPAL
jgi:hypothetical protein